MSVRLVVFDLAGTTVRDPGGVNGCFRAALAAAGVTITAAQADGVMGLPKLEALAILLRQTGREDLLPEVQALHDDFAARMIHYYQTDPEVGEVPGASAVFAQLKKAGVAIAVNTGFGRGITDVLLQRLGWSDVASIASDEMARGRPFPDMIHEFMRRFEVADAKQVAKIGDTPADLQEGTNAGCGWVIGVTAGTHSRAQLEQHPHTHLVETVAELPAVLGV